ncbi:MAG: acyltransferase family protein, partial [Acidobacteriota bacterium]
MAAVFVFSVHVSWPPLAGYHFLALPAFLDLGSQSVDIFFVLSGFVIGYVTDSREQSARAYTIRRLGRLYSVVLPALVATMGLDLLGSWMRPALYATVHEAAGGGHFWRYLASGLFVNEVWDFNVVPGINLPFWSLGYEAWYYLLFGIIFFSPQRLRWIAATFAVLAAGPKITALFPLWLAGVFCYRICKQAYIETVGASGLWILSLVGFFYYQAWYIYLHIHHAAPPPILHRPIAELWNDYVIGGLFVTNLIGFRFGVSRLGFGFFLAT